jgi:hypothetical protein
VEVDHSLGVALALLVLAYFTWVELSTGPDIPREAIEQLKEQMREQTREGTQGSLTSVNTA